MSGPVLVTGSSGFVGRHLIASLAVTGADVVAWSRSPLPPRSPDVRWQRVDLLSRDDVRAGIMAVKPQAVFHCAGVTQVDRSWTAPVEPLASNVLGSHYLFDALRRAARPCRVLVTGSAAVYAPSATPLTETAALAPDSPYAVSKLAQEALGIRAVVEDGLDVIVTRSFNHTGPGQTAAFVAPGIARQMALVERGAMEPVIAAGNVEVQRDITDVRDVIRAYLALMASGTPGEVYNVASGVGRTVRSIVDTLARIAGITVRIETDPSRLRPVDNPVLVGDASKLRALTGWEPHVPFETMLTDLLDYWRAAA